MAIFGKGGSDFLSKMKDAANSAAEKAKDAVDSAKNAYEAKKAEEEAKRQQCLEAAGVRAAEIKSAVEDGFNGNVFFEGIEKNELLKFSKEFYDKIVLPASSVSNSGILMYPNLDQDKKFNKFISDNSFFDKNETAIIYFRNDSKHEYVFTEKALYFSVPLADAKGYFSKERISLDIISDIHFEISEAAIKLMCNGYEISSVSYCKSANEDAISMNRYFQAVSTKDFIITDEEVDALIKEKIGAKCWRKYRNISFMTMNC